MINTLANANALFQRFQALTQDPNRDAEELNWTSGELKTAIKSIEWDLEDLGETVKIVEADPARFRITADEIIRRRDFIGSTKGKVKVSLFVRPASRTRKRLEKKSMWERKSKRDIITNCFYTHMQEMKDMSSTQVVKSKTQQQQRGVRQRERERVIHTFAN